MSNQSNAGGGIGVTGMLGVLFVALKLTGVVGWSWWWVTCPFWGPIAIFLAVGIVALLVWGFMKIIS